MNTTPETIKKENEDVILAESFVPVVEDSAETELAPLSATSLQHFKEEEQKEILRIADEINVLELEKIMSYGQIPLLRSFEEAGKILKEEQGSSADQEVIRQVIELAKQANESYEDFNLVLREPGFLQKILLKLFNGMKENHDKEVKYKAITNYKLLEQLRDSCETWIKMLQDAFGKIELSAYSDRDNCYELEQYIVAGYIAQERIQQEVESAKENWQQTGLVQAKNDYDKLREGLDTFQIVLLNLEKSRAAYGISIGQLMLQAKANKNIQIAVRTQKANSMALAGQQLRNAILDAKNREALEGQKSITKLNDELMQKIASNTVLTAEESEKVLLNGVYTVESALVAAKTVIDGCSIIEKARIDRLNNISQEMDKLKVLVDELAPYINDIKSGNKNVSGGDAKSVSNKTTSKGLKF